MAGYLCMRRIAVLLATVYQTLALAPLRDAPDHDPARHVDMFIGTEGSVPGTSFNGGNVFPGVAMPFGVVKIGVDTIVHDLSEDEPIEVNAGYSADGNVSAISLLHESGTGGAPKYGVIAQMPLTTLENVNLADNRTYMQPRTTKDVASVGHYKTSFQNGITAQISATDHAGFLEYTYPESGKRYVLVDVSHYLPAHGAPRTAQWYSNGRIELSDNGRRYQGYGVWRGGWGLGENYQVFMCGEFDKTPTSARTWRAPYTDPYGKITVQPQMSAEQAVLGGRQGYNFADRVGAIFEFPEDANTVKSRVGVSFISEEKACQFINEIPSWDLKDTADLVRARWNDEVFSKIQVSDTSNATRLTMLYSALYRSHLLPSNRTGENPFWESTEPYYDDIYTAWDTFRCLNSLYLLLEPSRAAEIIRALIDIWRHERFMPDGRSGNTNGRVQGGSNADNILADAYVKGLQMGINWQDGYLAIKTNAEVVPYNNFDPEDMTGSTKEGRGALPDWLKYGFITPNFHRSLSKTIEYSLNDFALSQVAKDIAPEEYEVYLNRSAGWQHIWHEEVTAQGFSGFIAPTWPNGSISVPNFDPLDCGECEWWSFCYEALPIEYAWTVPFDMESLVAFMGGEDTTKKRLDMMWVPNMRKGQLGSGGTNGIGTTLFNPGNEPSFATPYLYNYLQGKQYKTVIRTRDTVNAYYGIHPSGLPGNSDAGAIDAWLIWNLIGLYPVATQTVYLISSPFFSNVSIAVGEGAWLTVTADNLSDESFFIQSVKVNGQAWDKSWITHDDIRHGGTIEFFMGSEPTSWDSGELPPSPGHVVLQRDG